VSCAICGGSESGTLFDIPYLRPFRVDRCSTCGVAVTVPALDVKEISRYYPSTYYGKGGRKFIRLIESLVHLSRLRRAQRIQRYAPQGRILDVGCGGRTYFLESLHDLGWEVYGNELTDFPEFKELEGRGFRFQIRDFLACEYPEKTFDAVVFWHVLEHLPRTVEAVRKARGMLRTGGMLVLALPNRSSLQALWAGPHWFHLDIPRHYYHFTLETMKDLLIRQGFEIFYVSHFSFEQDLFAWIQSIYNKMGIRHNLLYNLLRNRHARIYAMSPALILQSLIVLSLLPAVGLASVILFFVDIVRRRGGSMEIYARKTAHGPNP